VPQAAVAAGMGSAARGASLLAAAGTGLDASAANHVPSLETAENTLHPVPVSGRDHMNTDGYPMEHLVATGSSQRGRSTSDLVRGGHKGHITRAASAMVGEDGMRLRFPIERGEGVDAGGHLRATASARVPRQVPRSTVQGQVASLHDGGPGGIAGALHGSSSGRGRRSELPSMDESGSGMGGAVPSDGAAALEGGDSRGATKEAVAKSAFVN